MGRPINDLPVILLKMLTNNYELAVSSVQLLGIALTPLVV